MRDAFSGGASGICVLILRIRNFMALCVAAFAGCGAEISLAEVSDAEKSSFYRAIAICQGMTKRPLALDPDKRVLCFDGLIFPELDVSLVDRLEDSGLAVVRSVGGDQLSAIRLADALRKRHATVVVYDYCLSACASFLLVASAKAYVLKNTLVAWHNPSGAYLCPSLEQAKDGGPRRLEKNTCSDAPDDYRSLYEGAKALDKSFYKTRAVAPPFENPPQSVIVRRILQNKFGERGEYPSNLLWTWNPRYYASQIKTKIIYEAYPQSQDEVDALAKWLQIRVIYDP
jgi:hypothetical protein